MIGVRGAVEIRLVTADARGTGRRKIVVGVTLRAVQPGVRPREGKAGELRMIKLRAHPAVHGMALLAVGWEVQRGVAGVVGLLKVRAVAGEAGSR